MEKLASLLVLMKVCLMPSLSNQTASLSSTGSLSSLLRATSLSIHLLALRLLHLRVAAETSRLSRLASLLNPPLYMQVYQRSLLVAPLAAPGCLSVSLARTSSSTSPRSASHKRLSSYRGAHLATGTSKGFLGSSLSHITNLRGEKRVHRIEQDRHSLHPAILHAQASSQKLT